MTDDVTHGKSQRDASTSPTVPLKRKLLHVTEHPTTPPVASTSNSSPPSTAIATPSSQPVAQTGNDEPIHCICGITVDTGFSIWCDGCCLWTHGECMGVDQKDKENLPERWLCWECHPRPIDRERARRIQLAKLAGLDWKEVEVNGGGGAGANAYSHGGRRRSPGVERKPRKPNLTAAPPAESSFDAKRRRRMSSAAGVVVSPTISTTNSSLPQVPAVPEDEHVNIDDDTSPNTYIDIANDIIPHRETRDKLRRHAHSWRGVTAINDDSTHPHRLSTTPTRLHPFPSPQHPISLQPVPNPSPFIPPTYSVHASRPIPSSQFITTYPSLITPTSDYLKDPLNAYALLGMPKPYVHLVGPPLDVALDARWYGGKGRWVRNGCRPNAIIRPIICRRKEEKENGKEKEGEDAERKGKEKAKERESSEGGEEDETLSFALFALKDLRAHDEVVLGWEWDDGNVVHQLPALIGSDTVRVGGKHSANSHRNFPHLRAQMSNILHSLQSTFTTCACGNSSKTCVLRRMREFVSTPDDESSSHTPAPPSDIPHLHTPAVPGSIPPNQAHGYFPPFLHPPPPGTPFTLSNPLFPPPPLPPPPTMTTPSVTDEDMEGGTTGAGPSKPRDPPPPSVVMTPTASSFPSFAHLLHPYSLPHQPTTEKEKEIWGPKTRMSARQKHPTLNLNLNLDSGIEFGPLIGTKRGFRVRERAPGSGGMGGCEMWPGEPEALEDIRNFRKEVVSPPPQMTTSEGNGGGEEAGETGSRKRDLRGLGLDTLDGGYWGLGSKSSKGKGKERAIDGDMDVDEEEGTPRSRRRTRSQQHRRKDIDVDMDAAAATIPSRPSPPPKSPSPPPLLEEQMPPKMRKRRIQMEAKALAEAVKEKTDISQSSGSGSGGGEDDMAVEDDGEHDRGRARELPRRTQSQIEMPPPPVPIKEKTDSISICSTASPPPGLHSSSPPPTSPAPSSLRPRLPSPSPASFAQLSLVSPTSHTSSFVPAEDSVPNDVPPPLQEDAPSVSARSPHEPSPSSIPPAESSKLLEDLQPRPSSGVEALKLVEAATRGSELSRLTTPLETKDTDAEDMDMMGELEYLDPTPEPPAIATRWYSLSPLHQWEPMTRVRPSSSSSSIKVEKDKDMERLQEGTTRKVKQELLDNSHMVVGSGAGSGPGADVEDGEVRDTDVDVDVVMNGVEEHNERPATSASATPPPPPPALMGSSPLSSPPPEVLDHADEDEDMDIDSPSEVPQPSRSSQHSPSRSLSAPTPVIEDEEQDPPPVAKSDDDVPITVVEPPIPSSSPEIAVAAPNGHKPPPRTGDITTPSPSPLLSSANLQPPRQESTTPGLSPQSVSSPLPSSPDAPLKKQKLSLKDFALRRKRMREAEEAAASKGDSSSRGEGGVDGQMSVSEKEAEKEKTNQNVNGQVDEREEMARTRRWGPDMVSTKMDLLWLLQYDSKGPPLRTANINTQASPSLNINDKSSSTTSPATSEPVKAASETASPLMSTPNMDQPRKLRITVKEALASIKAASNTTPGPGTPTITSASTPTSSSVPNPPANLTHKLPPRPNFAPPPSAGNIFAGDAITSIANPSILPGVIGTKSHTTHSPTEQPATPETPPWQRSEDDPRGYYPAPRPSVSQYTGNPKWDSWLKKKQRDEAEQTRKQKELERQREIDDEIDRQRIESDNRYLRQKEREKERERARERERERDDGYVDDGHILRYDEDQGYYRRSQSRDSVDRRRDDHWRNHERDRELAPRRRSFYDGAPETATVSSSKSPSPLPTPAKKSTSTAAFFSPPPPPPPDEPKAIVLNHTPVLAAPNLSSNPKWSPAIFTATTLNGGMTSAMLFNRASSGTPAPPPVPTTTFNSKSASPVPNFLRASPAPPPPPPPPISASPIPPPPPPPTSQRPRSPPTQPRSFSANPIREPPRAPRALMAHQGGGNIVNRQQGGGFPSTGRIREWDKEKCFSSGIDGGWSDSWRKGQ